MLEVLPFLFLVFAYFFVRIDFSQISDTLQEFVDVKTYEWFIGDCREEDVTDALGVDASSALSDVHVAYAVNENMFGSLLSSLLSLARHLEAPEECKVHLLVPAIEVDLALRLVDCFKSEMGHARIPTVKVHALRPMNLDLSSFKPVWEEVWPLGASQLLSVSFAELYLPEYVPEAPRVVLLSVHTVVKSDLGRLYRIPMKHTVAAALDMEWVTWRSEYMGDLENLDDSLFEEIPNLDARTFSNGVLLIDVARWLREDLTRKLEARVNQTMGVKTAQLALNLELQDRIDVLGWRWNVMGLMMLPPRRCLEQARVLHWAGPLKPWAENVPDRLQTLYAELLNPFLPVKECNLAPLDMLDSDFDITPP